MTAPRSRHQQLKYDRYQKTTDKTVCVFCDVKKDEPRFIEATSHFLVIRNAFPYSLWDNQGVSDHLMITPKMHTSNLGDISDAEKIEFFNLLEKYEAKGYNFFARSPHSKMKSVPHQHTHLIKPEAGMKRFVFALNKPYIRIAK